MRVARQHPELWKEMNTAERLVQRKAAYTWSWMNQFTPTNIREALYSLALEVLRLRAKVRKLEAQCKAN